MPACQIARTCSLDKGLRMGRTCFMATDGPEICSNIAHDLHPSLCSDLELDLAWYNPGKLRPVCLLQIDFHSDSIGTYTFRVVHCNTWFSWHGIQVAHYPGSRITITRHFSNHFQFSPCSQVAHVRGGSTATVIQGHIRK